MKPCAQPIGLERLVAYWLGELDERAAAPLEEHRMGCAHCGGRLVWLAACGAGVRAAVRGGAISLTITPAFLQAMKDRGLRVREYAVAPGGSVDCTITAEDDAVVSRLRAALAGVKRVDMVRTVALGGVPERWREQDVAFDEATGEVLVAPAAALLRTFPAHTQRMQLFAVEEGGERLLGEYTFRHTPG
jgi:hypothetical protein